MLKYLDMILALDNIFSYDEYVKMCILSNIEILTIGDYAQRVGMLKVAMNRFPGVSPDKAYLSLITEMNHAHSSQNNSNLKHITSTNGECKPCGKK